MVNDISIAAGLFVIFLSLSVITPYVTEEFEGGSHTQANYNSVETNMEGKLPEGSITSSGFSMINILKIIIGTLAWIPDLNAWINLVLIPFRLAMYFLIARNIWIGGGG